MNMRSIGRRVRVERMRLRESREMACARAGVSERLWEEVEAGRAMPTLRTISAIAGTIGVRLSELIAEGER